MDYVNMIKARIPFILTENENLNPHLKWEILKVELKEMSQQYSRHKRCLVKSRIITDLENLNQLEKEFVSHPTNILLNEKIIEIKKKIEIRRMDDTRAAQIRSGIKWRENGERCTRFFLSLEKSRAKDNTIHKVYLKDNDLTFDEKEILNEIGGFYENLYKEDKCERDIISKTEKIINDLTIPKITETEQKECDRSFTEKEIGNAVKTMKNGSSPGYDGIPIEFYKIFWNEIKSSLIASFEYSYDLTELSYSQRKGIISLLHKGKGLDRGDLSNWRPITLTNADYKILTKTLALRLYEVIKNIVKNYQKGFIKGRNIAELIREIDDIIEHEKLSASSSILFAIDYSKAFDTLSTTLIEKCFSLFGFGPRFQSWVKTLLKNRTFCVKNGGHISKEYPMSRGVRQGCPISPILFILTVELLAINVRQNQHVKGINIPDYETPHKIKQYADDTTFLLKDIIDFREVLSKIKAFSEISGLLINRNKSFVMLLGLNSTPGDEIFGFKIVKSMKILGVHFSTELATSENPLNWEPKIAKMQKLFGVWSRRDLSLIGKILIIKTFGLSQFVYLMQSVGMPTDVLQRINRIFFSSLWKRRFTNRRAFEKVKRKTMCSTQEHGGLKMINIKLMQTSFMLDWACKIMREEAGSWKYAPLQF